MPSYDADVPAAEPTRPREGPPQSLYDSSERPEIVPFVPEGTTSVLDVGCGNGGFGALLRARFGPGLRLVGIEPMEAARAAAGTRGFDVVLPGYFPDALDAGTGERFACIVFNDVLEHILDPQQALEAARDHLAPGGVVVASLPSILYLPVLARVVLRRRWDYTDAGTLDRTHVRFFTRANMVELFVAAGYAVERVQGVNNEWYTGRWGRVRRLAPLFGQFQWLQFAIVARPVVR